MMKKLLVLAAVMLLFGCISLPIEINESVSEVNLGADGSVGQVQTMTGPKTESAADWPADCTAKYKETMRSVVSMVQALGGMGGDLDAEQRSALANATGALNIIMDRSTCSFSSSNGDGTLVLAVDFSYDDMQQINELVGNYAEQNGNPYISIKRIEGGSYMFRMPTSAEGMGLAGSSPDEIRITVEGDAQYITPGYVEENGAYVYRNLDAMQEETIEVVYTPKPSGFCGMGLVLLAGTGILLALLASRKG